MQDNRKIERPLLVFQTFCQALDNEGWKYQKDEEQLQIITGAETRGFEFPILIRCIANRQILLLASRLPVPIKEELRFEVAYLVTIINNTLADGCFDFDLKTGNLVFRIANRFRLSVMSEAVCIDLLYKLCTVFAFTGKQFLRLANGEISGGEFLDAHRQSDEVTTHD